MGLGLFSIPSWNTGCLTPLSTIFQLYRGGQFIGGENRSIMRKLPTCRRSQKKPDILYHIALYRVHLAMSGVRTHNFSG